VRAILVAAKHLAFAKTRLAPDLPAAERAALAEAMFRDVLAAALSARSADHVAVVTSDPRLLEIARGAGALVIDEEYPRGLNVAVRIATEALVAHGAQAVCTVLSDIPLVTGEDIDAVMAAMPSPRGAVMVPSRDLSGTNIIARMPSDIIPTRFGSQSLARHREECERIDLPWRIAPLKRPAIDIDLMSDLLEFASVPGMTHTFSQVARLGIVHG